jgi:hypothetical protein
MTPFMLIAWLLSVHLASTGQGIEFIAWTFHKHPNVANRLDSPAASEIVREEKECHDRYITTPEYVAANIEPVEGGWRCEWFEVPCAVADLAESPGTTYVGVPTASAGPLPMPNEYRYQPLGGDLSTRQGVRLSVKACNDGHVSLSSHPSATGDLYELVLGGWGNSLSVLRKCKQGCELLRRNTPSILSCLEKRKFWISWAGGLIQVGTGWGVGTNAFIQYLDAQPPAINHLSVSNGFGSTGEWEVYW